jgi:hypothetical protein
MRPNGRIVHKFCMLCPLRHKLIFSFRAGVILDERELIIYKIKLTLKKVNASISSACLVNKVAASKY